MCNVTRRDMASILAVERRLPAADLLVVSICTALARLSSRGLRLADTCPSVEPRKTHKIHAGCAHCTLYSLPPQSQFSRFSLTTNNNNFHTQLPLSLAVLVCSAVLRVFACCTAKDPDQTRSLPRIVASRTARRESRRDHHSVGLFHRPPQRECCCNLQANSQQG